MTQRWTVKHIPHPSKELNNFLSYHAKSRTDIQADNDKYSLQTPDET